VELLGPLARILAQRFRVISYQLRGEDDCFAMRRRFGLTELVDDLHEFLDWHCLERPVLVGVSFGGVLALEYAVRQPYRLAALAVQGVGGRFESGLVHRLAWTVLSRYPLPPDNPFVNQFFNLLFGGPQERSPLSDFVIRHWWQTDQSVMAHRLRLVECFDLHGRLDEIAAPTLILAGDRDVLVSPRGLAALANEIPSAKLVRLAGAGHLAFVTQPQRLGEEVSRFLSQWP
jgi:pimeloyl-ACP methyl ester carboxylesterase